MRIFFYTIVFLTLCSICNEAKGQRTISLGLLKITDINGEVGLDGFYNKRLYAGQSFNDIEKISHIAPTVNIKTKSYLWNSNFLYLKINTEYSPEFKRNISEVFPDRIDDISKKKFGLHGELFKNSKIIVSGFYNINDNFYNSENISSVKSKSKTWGFNLGSRDPRLPLIISSINSFSELDKLPVNHQYTTNKKKIVGSIKRTFFKNDKHKFKYEYTDVSRGYSFTEDTKQELQFLGLNSVVFLDKSNNHRLNSNIQNSNRKGILNTNNFSLDENYEFKLPYEFIFNTKYRFSDFSGDFSHNKANSIIAQLNHQLYSSLNTNILYEYRRLNHTSFNETNIRKGIQFKYKKKVPAGFLNLSYNFTNERSSKTDISDVFYIYNEAHVISDLDILLLDNPNIVLGSIVVKSLGGSIIYHENIDYYLIDQGDYIDLQRIPGGEITNNDIILVDYVANREFNDNYNLNSNMFRARITLFKYLLSVYFSIEDHKFAKSANIENSSFREYTVYSAGIESRTKYYKVGIKYEEQEGEILSYNILRSYANGYIDIKKIRFSLSNSYSKYLKSNNLRNQSFFSTSLNTRYLMRSKSSIVYSLDYRNQDGQNIYLNFLKSKIKYQSQIRAWTYSFGLEYFHRNMTNNDVELGGIFVSLKRVF
ncbi:MAG: hypothetical protein KAS71_12690 [Bacteroidales bacterium]|nr:hypothetical protein [Bacteroidales bacterium]